MNDAHDLKVILESHFPIVTIQTHEEKRAIALISRVASKIPRSLYTWSSTDGLKSEYELSTAKNFSLQAKDDHYQTKNNDSSDPDAALKLIKNSVKNAVIVLSDFHSYLTEPTTLRRLKEIALDQVNSKNTVVMISHNINVPGEISRLCANFSLSLPDTKALEQLVHDEAKIWTLKNSSNKVKADRKSIELMVRNLQGLTVSDAKRLIRNAIYNDGAITQSDLTAIMKAKYELLGQDGSLSFEYDTSQFSDVGGFSKLIRWTEQRKSSFLSEDNTGLDIPKGVLLLGIQGCGKSLAARAIAGVWGIPLLRLDFGALYNKFFGETEKNIRQSLATAELMSPCVLWMDEVEKGIATGDNDNGTSRRILATLLTWMAENKKRVFIVATANDIQSLPPELIRKGRMDEIFFVDLPDTAARAEILKIHIARRGQDPTNFDMETLAQQCDGFSGAEIEQAIVSAIYAAHGDQKELNTEHIDHEIAKTQPLSVVMSEKIASLRAWAQGRTVKVD
ncbi:MAG: AAA family ATPase [Thiohalomonadales bacterium]